MFKNKEIKDDIEFINNNQWYLLHGFNTERQKESRNDFEMSMSPLCYQLRVAVLPDQSTVLLFDWILLSETGAQDGIRRTSPITHIEDCGKWIFVETVNSIYMFKELSSEEVNNILNEHC